MTITQIETVYGVQTTAIDFLKRLLSNKEWISTIDKDVKIPNVEEISMNDNETYDFFINYVLNRKYKGYKGLCCQYFLGQRHKHNDTDVVVGIVLFSSMVEGPESTCSFSMEDIENYQKKISDCKQLISNLFHDYDYQLQMFAVANDCQCCS